MRWTVKHTDSDIDIATLVDRARRGDQQAMDCLFALASDRLRLFIRLRIGARLRQHVESIDVLQCTYLEAHRKLRDFDYRGDREFLAWLCRIAVHQIHDIAKHHGADKRTPKNDGRQVSRVLDELKASGFGVVTLAQRAEEARRLRVAIDGLPEDSRRIVLMRFFENRTIDEIVSEVGRSASSVRRAIARSVAALGELLNPA